MGEKGKVNAEKTTVQTLMKNFLLHRLTRSPQQHVDMIDTFTSFCKCFGNTKKYLIKAKMIKDTPLVFFIENKPEYFSKQELKQLDRGYRLPEMDFVYFRDTQFNKKLKTEYTTSTKTRRRYHKKMIFAQLLDILSYLREVLYNDFVEIANENDFEIPMVLPAVQSNDTRGVGIAETTP